MLIVVMGVSGSGKTTVGTMLAEALDCPYLDGDALHPEANIEAMSRGIPLTDSDRAPWLAAIRDRLADAHGRGRCLVVGASALKESYRVTVARGLPVTWVYLKGHEELIRSRLLRRAGHFMKADMLASQLAVLEEPSDAIVADISRPPGAIVDHIMADLRTEPDVRVSADLDALSSRVAAAMTDVIRGAVRRAGRCSLALSGGSTPRTLYRLLASRFRDGIPWAHVHVFWGDERYVPHHDARSNYLMARRTLLDHVPCPAANVHPMPTDLPDPEVAAREYEETLRSHFAGEEPRFDLVLLGIGADGHTASLFPGAPAMVEDVRWVVPAVPPDDSPLRLTLTLPVLERSVRSWFLASGPDKAREVARVLTGAADPAVYATAAIQLSGPRVTWWLDSAAAGEQAAAH